MNHKNYKGVYDYRIIGLYNGHNLYYDKGEYVIERKYWKKPTPKEIKEIKKKVGDLEKELKPKDLNNLKSKIS